MQDVIKRSISVSREACHSLSEISLGENLATHLANLTEFLSLECEPPIVWFSPDKVASSHLADTLRFGMLELQEHLETFLDKKRQASEVSVYFFSEYVLRFTENFSKIYFYFF